MAYTEAQKRATMKYLSEKVERVNIYVPKGTKDNWKEFASLHDLSLTKLITKAVEEYIK